VSSANLSSGKQNAIYTLHCRATRMQLYIWGWQKPKWKDPKTSNVETQAQVYVSGVGIREGISLKWSHGFGLDELDV
jgi:hypothetical protein